MHSIKNRVLSIVLGLVTFFSVFLTIDFGAIKQNVTAETTQSARSVQLLWGTFTDSNTRTQLSDYDSIKDSTNWMSTDLTAWRNDTVYSRILLWTKNNTPANNVSVSVGEFKNSRDDVLPQGSVEVSFIHDTNDHMYGVDVADIVWNSTTENIPANSLKSVWVTVNIPEIAQISKYVGDITVTCDDGNTLTFTINIEVIGLTRVEGKNNNVTVENWLYPYTVDRYYSGLTSDDYFYDIKTGDGYLTTNRWNVAEYVDRLYNIRLNRENEAMHRAHIKAYAEAGGTAITATCQEDPWGSQCPDPYPSMIKWIKKMDGTFKFDYSDFDYWVKLNLEYGVDKQIKTFSIASWTGLITYFDEASNSVKVDSVPISQSNLENWKAVWTPFVKDYMAHTKEMGWFDITYIAIDEREAADTEAVVDLIESIKDENGKCFKSSYATNWNDSQNYLPLYDRITDISFAYQLPNQFNWDVKTWAENRRNQGLMTTLYTCGAQCNSLINSPAESVFCMLKTAQEGVDGFLRWAFDSFNLEPHVDGSGSDHPSGDLFLIYPSDRDDREGNVRSSIRLEKMSEGIRLMSKINTIRNYNSEMANKVDEILNALSIPWFEEKQIINAETNEEFNYYSIVGYIDKDTGSGVYGNIDFVSEVSTALSKLNDLARNIALRNLINEAQWENSPTLQTAIETAGNALNTATTSSALFSATVALEDAMLGYEANDIGGMAANDILGWQDNSTPTWSNTGAKMSIVGNDSGNSWSENGRINYNRKLDGMFNIENGKTVSFKFKLGMKEAGASTNNYLNGNSSEVQFFLIVRDVNNLGDEIMRIRFLIKSNTANDNPIHAIAQTKDGEAGVWWDTVGYDNEKWGTGQRWVTGAPNLDSEYYFAFNKEDLLMAPYNDQPTILRPLVNKTCGTATEIGCGAWFFDVVQSRLTNTKAICFDIQGEGGFDKNVDLIVTEINGQSLANNGSTLTNKALTTYIGETEKFMTLGYDYTINSFKAKHIWQDDGGVKYSISWTGAETQAKKSGLVFSPKTSGLYDVTVYAEHEHFGNGTKSFSIYIIDIETLGSSVRLSDGSLRFHSRMNKTDYDYLINNGYTVTVGTALMPERLGDPLYDNADTLKIDAIKTITQDGYVMFNGVITNMPSTSYSDDIGARAYVLISNADESYIEYSQITTRSLIYIVNSALSDVSDTQGGKFINQVEINGQTKWSQYTQDQIELLLAFKG